MAPGLLSNPTEIEIQSIETSQMINDVRNMSVEDIQEELNEMEDSYGIAFSEGTSPEVLQAIWERIKELKTELERRKKDSKLMER